MGKKQKIGKARRDKFYHLAKETGYRARSAFKLIQLNRKFNFLSKSRVLIDLCAAPGGWLQVASNFMPMSSVILGVDLVSIKPIKNVTTFTADITTETCRQHLKKELKTWKADCVLNDGAPNVGSAWVQDAFTQAELTLSALKLACEFLKKGGWFITKVFRSKDYAKLLVAFQALFKKVHATKPQASRNESAEIFVVCQGFLAPAKLDPKLVDVKHVFQEIEETKKRKIDIFKPEKQKRQREGYEDGNYILFSTTKVSDFISCENPIEVLSTTNQLVFDDDKYANHPLTTQEVKLCCEDIKVLGKRELKNILTWRRKLHKEEEIARKAASGETAETSEGKNEDEEETEESLDKMIEDLKESEKREAKRKKRRDRESKKKISERIGKKAAGDNNDSVEMDLFRLTTIKNKEHLGKVENQEEMDDNDDELYHEDDGEELEFESEGSSDDDEEDADDENNSLYDDDLYGPKRPNLEEESIQLTDEQKKVVESLKNRKKNDDAENPLIVQAKDGKNENNSNITSHWFQKDIFKSIEDDEEEVEDYDIEKIMRDHKKKGTVIIGEDREVGQSKEKDNKKTRKEKESQERSNVKENMGGNEDDDRDDEDYKSESEDSEIDDRSISQGRQKTDSQKREKAGTFEVVSQRSQEQKYLTPEALALGGAMATSRKRKREIIDDAYNRYSFGDENLPDWFSVDEKKHTSIQLPVTREEVFYYKERLKAINARPMKKLMEAQARKKKKLLKKMEKVRKKADNILETEDVSEKEKMYQIKSIYKKAGLLKQKKVEKQYIVAKKGLAGKRYPRPSGVKGHYKVVDPRMKKDLRAMKNKEKTKNRGKKSKGKKMR